MRNLHTLFIVKNNNTCLELRRTKDRHLYVRVVSIIDTTPVPITSWSRTTLGRLLRFNNIPESEKARLVQNQQFLINGGKYVSRETF